jgi:hypothetical protein
MLGALQGIKEVLWRSARKGAIAWLFPSPIPPKQPSRRSPVIVSLREASKGGAGAFYVHVVVGTCCEGAEQAVHSRAQGGQGFVRIVLRSEGCGNKGVSRIERGEERVKCKIRGCC